MFIEWDTTGCLKEGIATLSCIPYVFQNIVTAALVFSTTVAIFFIVYSGIKFITSGGDPKGVEAARKTFFFAVAGVIIIFLSFLVITLIGGVTGVSCIAVFGFDSCI